MVDEMIARFLGPFLKSKWFSFVLDDREIQNENSSCTIDMDINFNSRRSRLSNQVKYFIYD